MIDTLHQQSKFDGAEIEYPTSDGQPMAETDLHRDLTIETIEALKARYAGQQVYVSGDNFIYWEEGNPRKSVSPDTYVVFGVEMRRRDCYKSWEEGGRLPDVVIEFTSKSTRHEDVRVKRPLYEKTLRVPEYFIFDPTGDYQRPRLRGFRLIDGEYVPLEVVDECLRSEVLGLDLVQQGNWLRLREVNTGNILPTLAEVAESAANAESEIARLRAELDVMRRKATE